MRVADFVEEVEEEGRGDGDGEEGEEGVVIVRGRGGGALWRMRAARGFEKSRRRNITSLSYGR